MIDAPSARRMAENEVVFRTYNETMQQGLVDLAQVAKEDRQEHLMLEAHEELHFYCECSDENCRERIIMPPQTYADCQHDVAWWICLVCEQYPKSIDEHVKSHASA